MSQDRPNSPKPTPSHPWRLCFTLSGSGENLRLIWNSHTLVQRVSFWVTIWSRWGPLLLADQTLVNSFFVFNSNTRLSNVENVSKVSSSSWGRSSNVPLPGPGIIFYFWSERWVTEVKRWRQIKCKSEGQKGSLFTFSFTFLFNVCANNDQGVCWIWKWEKTWNLWGGGIKK